MNAAPGREGSEPPGANQSSSGSPIEAQADLLASVEETGVNGRKAPARADVERERSMTSKLDICSRKRLMTRLFETTSLMILATAPQAV